MNNIFLLGALALLTNVGFGQKLPNVQQGGVRAPANVKIDGKGGEWGSMKAYNKAAVVYYTLANDAHNLYLVVQADDPTIVKKITAGGISLKVYSPEQKREKGAVTVTFPAYEHTAQPFFLSVNQPVKTIDTMVNRREGELLMQNYNKQLGVRYKMIGVTGVSAIPDSALSVYNDMGVKASAGFDHSITYTQELALPLKYLDKVIAQGKFGYTITLNGAIGKSNIRVIESARGPRFMFTGTDGVDYVMPSDQTAQNTAVAYTTNFSGEYTLVK